MKYCISVYIYKNVSNPKDRLSYFLGSLRKNELSWSGWKETLPEAKKADQFIDLKEENYLSLIDFIKEHNAEDESHKQITVGFKNLKDIPDTFQELENQFPEYFI